MSNLPYSEQWYQAAKTWADLESAASILEETKSVVLNQMKLKLLGDATVSVAKAETTVKGSPQWETYVTKMVQARTAANKAKLYMEFLKMRFWENQSDHATERVQARL